MHEFERIKDMVYCEIDDISNRGQLDMNTVKVLGELVDILKDISQMELYEDGIDVYDDQYSYSGGYNRNMNNGGYSQKRMPIYYNDGNSYRSSGRNNGYSRRGRGYSYEDSKSHMIDKLHNLMQEAQDQNDKNAIQRLIDQMENN